MTSKTYLIASDIFLLVVLLLTIYELRLAIVNPLGIFVRVGFFVLVLISRVYTYKKFEVKENVGV